MASALVFNIQRYSIHDGPGIRTTVFLKGCPLRCPWCSNPESQSGVRQLMYDKSQCTNCGWCAANCPRGAVEVTDRGYHTSRELCARCTRCVCTSGAKRIAGQEMTAEEVLAVVEKDALFYHRSGGGVTLSGGEPLLHPDFAQELLRACRERGIGTAVETTGHVKLSVLERVLPWLDVALIDLKYADPRRHEEVLGADNALVLQSIRRLARWEGELRVRIPVIPGWNDDADNLAASAAVLREAGVGAVTLLPYHRMGSGKYDQLDWHYLVQASPPDSARMGELSAFLREKGLEVLLG